MLPDSPAKLRCIRRLRESSSSAMRSLLVLRSQSKIQQEGRAFSSRSPILLIAQPPFFAQIGAANTTPISNKECGNKFLYSIIWNPSQGKTFSDMR